MKKLSSMAALGLALALTFGMTVSAAESATTEGTAPEMKEEQVKEYTEKSESLTQAVGSITVTVGGKTVELKKEPVAPETLLQAEQIAAGKAAEKAAELNLNVSEGKEVRTNVVGSADITGITIPEGSSVQLDIPISGIKAGKTYILLHLTGGVWETIIPDSVADGKLTATFRSLSPVIASEVMIVEVNEETDDDSDSSQTQDQAAAASPGTSPKTAETFPIAGMAVMICLAGAAVCANKVHCNR